MHPSQLISAITATGVKDHLGGGGGGVIPVRPGVPWWRNPKWRAVDRGAKQGLTAVDKEKFARGLGIRHRRATGGGGGGGGGGGW